jgi:ABC-type ATPase involved in cell division
MSGVLRKEISRVFQAVGLLMSQNVNQNVALFHVKLNDIIYHSAKLIVACNYLV